MKKIYIMTILIIAVLALSACSGALVNKPQDDQDIPEMGMEFAEAEISEPGSENEFVFTEEDVQDDPPENDEPAGNLPVSESEDPEMVSPEDESEDPEMIFPEDEVEPITERPTAALPPTGESSWEVTHKDGTITCTTGTQNFGEGEIETIRIEANADLDFFILWNFEGNPDGILFTGYGKDNQITHYEGQLEIPGTDGELHFVVSFENPSGGTVATNMYGTISSEMQGCAVTRDFTGVLVD